MKSGERVVVADDESEAAASSVKASLDFLKHGGEMGELIRALDWSKTPLGPMESWPLALRMMVGFLLANRFPLLLWWGPEYVSIYNDAYRPILGRKHPWALGLPVRECWEEIWHVLRPLIDAPFSGGPATWMEDIELEINRYGFTEETHFTIAYSPVPDETAPRGIGGVLATVHEITEKVIAERRAAALRDLGKGVGESETAEDTCAIAAATLENCAKDVPFALLYLIDPDGKSARLAGSAGIGKGGAVGPAVVDLDHPESESGAAWPLSEAVRRDEMVIVEDLRSRFDAVPPGPWSDPPCSAVMMPVRSIKAHQPAGLLIAGISPRLRLDNLYRAFLELVTTQVATSIAKARAYEEERKRAEALAEIDRAKTAFFSNVSHEFRTPLTLMLGPLEEELVADTLGPASRERLALVHRSGLRLQKLVNSLLDFSRIEAGRVQAVYEPTDLAGLTTDLASNFQSAMEKAGLRFEVNCPPISEPVYVDREMWEKIVLNLLSNAFKFTFEGSVTIALRPVDEGVELSVEDSGTGIPADEIPNLFERFHRVKDARGRTFEGTGIGLALVNELVKLHGGCVRVESELGKGSAFRVYIPFGARHVPEERISGERTLTSTALRSEVVAEALRWLPDHPSVDDSTSGEPVMEEVPLAGPPGVRGAGPRRRVLVADDNADMRQYIQRLLSRDYHVTAVANGEDALKAAREQLPDLVLSDAMMPGLDGFGLLRELRADPLTAMVPVILLSARAGEESRIEGLDAGADDYLIKPFSARELTARVRAVLALAHVRREAQGELLKRETDLRRANEELEQFAYSASHDLKEPLRMVMAYSQLLSRRSSGKLDSQENEFLGRVLQGAQRMEALLGDLLRYARVASAPERSNKAAELNAVFERALGNLQAAIEESRAQITCGPLPALFVEPIRLQQVFQNLIGNAIKYRRPEGQACIGLSARKDGAEWIFSVQDNGVGIEPQYQQQIFGLFKRLHNDTSSGSGLGLAICQRTVEHYGGRIWVESNPGHGSTFFFALPAALEHAAPLSRLHAD